MSAYISEFESDISVKPVDVLDLNTQKKVKFVLKVPCSVNSIWSELNIPNRPLTDDPTLNPNMINTIEQKSSSGLTGASADSTYQQFLDALNVFKKNCWCDMLTDFEQKQGTDTVATTLNFREVMTRIVQNMLDPTASSPINGPSLLDPDRIVSSNDSKVTYISKTKMETWLKEHTPMSIGTQTFASTVFDLKQVEDLVKQIRNNQAYNPLTGKADLSVNSYICVRINLKTDNVDVNEFLMELRLVQST